ncbi:MAG: YbcC family protein [Tagaea sp.]
MIDLSLRDESAVQTQTLPAAVEAAVRAIPPAWPVAANVAVNPFLGQTGETLARAGARLARTLGVAVTMPRDWYLERVRSGAISEADLAAAIAACPEAGKPATPAALLAAAAVPASKPVALPTIADLCAEASGVDWPGLIAERFGAWAADHFDEGQALWAAPKGKGAYAAWRAHATHDLTHEIAGLRGFAAFVADSPETADAARARAAAALGLTAPAMESYFHRLLAELGGWSQFARYRLWQAEMEKGADSTLADFLAIRLLWEQRLFELHAGRIEARWRAAEAVYAQSPSPGPDLIVDAILQDAAERAVQRDLVASLDAPGAAPADGRPWLQAAFCIDVRSEVFRRALEALDPGHRTIGFAGFFGLFVRHKRYASDVEEARCPVLLNTNLDTCAGGGHDGHDHAHAGAERETRFAARARRAWGRFKLAAVSSFAFVEAMGPVYAGKLVGDSLALKRAPAVAPEPAPLPVPDMPLDARVAGAEAVLRAMSLTSNFARIVLLAGHGANVVNNPHASALHCGACGGYSGEVNARLLAALLNDPAGRQGVAARGLAIPEDTLFVGGLHDTTTDAVLLYDADAPAAGHAADIARLRDVLARAGRAARAERALRLPRAADPDTIEKRSRDWAEVRPEWALAGCKAFLAAPRARTAGRDLAGRAFLHDYDWRLDSGFGVLELIMTAPVVVASWISLQYYGSTVAPEAFGAGNKLLHNVVGGIGVFEGNGGVLRAGLPWQSVHDGEKLAHEPLRLSVFIEAPRDAMLDVLRKHPGVRDLFDNGWLHLFALDESGRVAWRYARGLAWEAVAR